MNGPLRGAALGFKAHTGWAAAVAVAGPPAAPEVVDKRRIEMAAGFDDAAEGALSAA